jgi:hypothetical protein
MDVTRSTFRRLSFLTLKVFAIGRYNYSDRLTTCITGGREVTFHFGMLAIAAPEPARVRRLCLGFERCLHSAEPLFDHFSNCTDNLVWH